MRASGFPLSIGFALLGIVALSLFALPLWYAWHVTVDGSRIERLQEDASHLTSVFEHRGAEGLATFINERLSLRIANERILLFSDASLKPIAGNLPGWPSDIPSTPGISTGVIYRDGKQIRALVVRTALPGGYNLLVGRDVGRLMPLELRFWYGLAGAIGVFLLVGLIGGILVQRAVLARIDGFSRTISKIVQGDLSQRLALSRRNDEFDALSRILNRMLEQIEHLVHGVQNVSNSIAHDLRTPLTELRARLEGVAMTRPSSDEVMAEIESAIADVDRVIGIFNALLRLAKIDSGISRSDFIQIDAADATAKAVEFYQPSAEQKGIRLTFSAKGNASILGDSVLLTQAVGNLIDNALKFTHENGVISVEAQRLENGAVEITVSDNGPGIPDTEKRKVIERFYRGDTSRGTPGIGLGLSLVGAVANLHEGSLEFLDNQPGLRAKLVLPGIR